MLEIDNVVKTFNGFAALKGVSLDANHGAITGLIGPNGSGKTTLFNAITGVSQMDSGQVRLFGQLLDTRRPDLVARRGIARTFQVPRLALRMTVIENLLVARRDQAGERIRRLLWPTSAVAEEEIGLLEESFRMAGFLDLPHLSNELAGTLSGGQLKLLSLGMALMSNPEVLLLDEPVAGVSVALIPRILEILETIRKQDKIVIIVEHNIRVISDICHQVYVLDGGEVIASGTPQEIQKDPSVRRAYLGIKAES
jgi:neutral amino acid transport system ATP-binding protein